MAQARVNGTTKPFDILNHEALHRISARFQPAIIQEEAAPVPHISRSIFEVMSMSRNIELDEGDFRTIDVQSDFRFIYGYICYHIEMLYPEFNVKGYPYISTLSLVAYCLTLVHAHFLTCDMFARRRASYFSLPFKNDAFYKDYYELILNSHVPPFMKELLDQLAPTIEPRRKRFEYCPSYAGFSLDHDFGRFVPVHVMLAAHDIMASNRLNLDPHVLVNNLYTTELLQYAGNTRRINNLFGTNYHIGDADFTHANWFNETLESIFNPNVGRALLQKPTFARTRLLSYRPNADQFNPYIYGLSCQGNNIDILTAFVTATSQFMKTEYPSSVSLGRLFDSVKGITVLSHSIEPPTLPTWHALTDPKGTPLVNQTNEEFAAAIEFMAKKDLPTGTLPYPTGAKSFSPDFYLVTNSEYDKDKDPDGIEEFSGDDLADVYPYVLYFQPYDVSPSSLAYTILMGIKIELGEIDGFTVPTENPYSSLDDNNSQVYQGSVRLDRIKPAAMDGEPIVIQSRYQTSSISQAIGLAFRTMARNILPRFCINQAPDALPPALIPEENHTNGEYAYTYTACYHDEAPNMEKKRVYGWSSFRIRSNNHRPTDNNIFMLLSFRPFYGLNVTLSRSKNPALIIPK